MHEMYTYMKVIPEQTFLRRNHVTKITWKMCNLGSHQENAQEDTILSLLEQLVEKQKHKNWEEYRAMAFYAYCGKVV